MMKIISSVFLPLRPNHFQTQVGAKYIYHRVITQAYNWPSTGYERNKSGLSGTLNNLAAISETLVHVAALYCSAKVDSLQRPCDDTNLLEFLVRR